MTDTDEWARRGSSFGAVAAVYAEHRPDYPVDAVRWCVAPAGRDIGALRVLDLGAGTGKLTAMLAQPGAEVTAVEPDPEMLGELRRGLPSVRALPGSAEQIPLEILFEDNDLVVVNKPAGLVVHPGAGHREHTLVNALLNHCSMLSGIGGKERPGIVHRLDKETSGCLVVAKNDAAHRGLSKQFADRTVQKIYLRW